MAPNIEADASRRAWPITLRLTALVASILLPIVVLVGALIWRVGVLDEVRANQQALQIARSVAGDLERDIAGSIETLLALASSPALLRDDLADFHRQAKEVLQYRRLNALLKGTDGKQLLNTRLPFGTPINPQSLFEHDRIVIETRRPVMSKLIVGNITQKWQLALSVPVIIGDQVRYVLSMSIDPEHIRRIISETPRDPGWIIAVSDASGRLIARSLDHGAYVGQIVHPNVQGWSPPPEGIHRTASLAGHQVLRGYHWLARLDWMASAFVPVQVVAAPLRELWWMFCLTAGALALLSFPLTYLLGKRISTPIAEAASDAQRLGRGDHIDAKTSSLLEANELSAALAAASGQLRERTQALAANEARFRSVFEQSAVGFVQAGLDGRLIGVNDRLCKMLGYTREECLEKTFRILTHADDLATEEALIASLMKNERPHYDLEKRVIKKSGETIWVHVTSALVRSDDGTVMHRTSVVEDVTERRKAREAAARLASIVQTSQDAIISTCPTGRVETWNNGAVALFGYTQDEMIGQSLDLLVPVARKHELKKKLDAAMNGETVKIETVRLHKDGTPIDVTSTAAPISSNGRITAVSVTMEDIRDRKKREAQISLLNRELAHRIKNTLAVIQSIANQTMRSTPAPEAFRIAFQGRLQALAAANDLLMQSSWEGSELEDFIDRQLAPLMPRASRQLHRSGPKVILPADFSIPLGLALHELGTNAIKHGAWSVAGGQVRLTWTVEPDQAGTGTNLKLIWSEHNGPPVNAPTRSGFGTTIIERGIPKAKVTRSFDSTGAICAIHLPLLELGASQGRSGFL